jgi:hypothetical protein
MRPQAMMLVNSLAKANAKQERIYRLESKGEGGNVQAETVRTKANSKRRNIGESKAFEMV